MWRNYINLRYSFPFPMRKIASKGLRTEITKKGIWWKTLSSILRYVCYHIWCSRPVLSLWLCQVFDVTNVFFSISLDVFQIKYVIHDSVLRNYWNIRNCIWRTINRLIKTDSIMAIPKSMRLNVSSTSVSVTTSMIVNVTALKFQYWNKCDMLSQFLLMKCCFMSNGEEIK